MSSVFERFSKAWSEFESLYREASLVYSYNGYNRKTKESDPGPHFWSEQDIVLHLSFLLQKEFGKFWIHNELSIAKHTFQDVNATMKREYIDIIISDPDKYAESWRKTHDAFVEIKWITKGKIFRDYDRLRESSEKDCAKLKAHFDKKRCLNGYLCIVDNAPSESKINRELRDRWETDYPPVKVFILSMKQQAETSAL